MAGEGKTNIYTWRNGMQCARCREYKGWVHGAAQLCHLGGSSRAPRQLLRLPGIRPWCWQGVRLHSP